MHTSTRWLTALGLALWGLLAQAATTSFIGCARPGAGGTKTPSHIGYLCQTQLPIADARGRGAEFGEKVALSGSNRYVILKDYGHRLDVIQRAETVLRALIRSGYPRVGLVLADGRAPSVMEVYSGGRTESYEVLRNVDADNAELGIGNVVKEAYERDIGPRQTPTGGS